MPTYIRLTDYKSSDEKEKGFFDPDNRYEAKQEDFEKIPGSPVAYWVSDRVKDIFGEFKKLKDLIPVKKGMSTAKDDYFLKLWYEVDYKKKNLKWFPITKGGDFRKWYGSNEYFVNWENNGYELKNFDKAYIRNEDSYFKKSLTWSYISSYKLSFREISDGFLATAAGPLVVTDDKYFLSLLNTNISNKLISFIGGATITFEVGEVGNLPIIFQKNNSTKQKIETITQQNIDISKEEWDSRETSWDFRINELIRMKNEELKMKNCKLEDVYNRYCDYWREKFFTLHANEEELNRLFIEIYELGEELTPDVELKDITILKNEAKIIDSELVFQAEEIMKQFISYGVGVMFGRYSLDSDGLLIADMGQDVPTSASFVIDDDNIIPVLEDDYFSDDIASRFVQFVKVVFGEESLSENIAFLENSLGVSLRKYFVKGFYEDHIKRYKKRPIYWMVASPKKGFMALLYMHRYEADTFARVRNSYLTEYIAKLEAHKDTLTLTTSSSTASNADKKKADKDIKKIDSKLKEMIEFDREKMMSISQNSFEIDLDDGVKVNYCKFKDILYPITGLCK